MNNVNENANFGIFFPCKIFFAELHAKTKPRNADNTVSRPARAYIPRSLLAATFIQCSPDRILNKHLITVSSDASDHLSYININMSVSLILLGMLT